MKHYFYLVLDKLTLQARYSHGFYKDLEELRGYLYWREELIKVWEIKEEVAL